MMRASKRALLLVLTLASCGEEPQSTAAPQPSVDVIAVSPQPVAERVELAGRVRAIRTAEVRARTDGIVLNRLYTEGTDVAAGTPLFSVDSRELAAQADEARGALARAEAARDNSARLVERLQGLVGERGVSAQDFDAARATLRQEQAGVVEAAARLARARLLLDFATVRAPIAGRAGRAQVTEGALVSAGAATLLTTVEQLDPIHVVFTAAAADVLSHERAGRTGQLRLAQTYRATLKLPDGTTYERTGELDLVEQNVDPETGTITLRAVFPNPERTLLPGQFVRVTVEVGTIPAALVVPARAVRLGGDAATVAVLRSDGTVADRPVRLGSQLPEGFVITEGLRPGEKVITDGWQKLTAGARPVVRHQVNG